MRREPRGADPRESICFFVPAFLHCKADATIGLLQMRCRLKNDKPTHPEADHPVLQDPHNANEHDERGKWQSFFQGVSHPIMIVGPDHEVLGINKATAKALNRTEEEVLGRKCFEFFHGAAEPPEGCPVVRLLSSGRTETIEMEMETLDGTYLVSCTPVPDRTGKVSQILHMAVDITERKRAEQAIVESQRTLRSLIDATKEAVLLIDVEGKILVANETFAQRFGKSVQELKGTSMYEHLPPEVAARRKEEYDKVVGTGQPVRFWDARADRAYESYGYPVFDNEGRVAKVAIFAVDITERRRAEEALAAKTQELDRYFTNSLDLLCIADTDGYFRRLNPEWEKTLGYPTSELEGMKFLDLVHPDDMKATLEVVEQLSRQKDIQNFINRYRCKDGSYRWLEWRSYPEGKLIYAVARDITNRKRAEEALRDSEATLRSLIDATRDALLLIDPEGKILVANETIAQGLGRSLQELVGTCQYDYFPPEVAARRKKAYDKVVRTGQPVHFLDERAERAYESYGYPVFDREGRVAKVAIFAVDITERRRAEEALREGEQRFQTIFEESPYAIALNAIPGGHMWTPTGPSARPMV